MANEKEKGKVSSALQLKWCLMCVIGWQTARRRNTTVLFQVGAKENQNTIYQAGTQACQDKSLWSVVFLKSAVGTMC